MSHPEFSFIRMYSIGNTKDGKPEKFTFTSGEGTKEKPFDGYATPCVAARVACETAIAEQRTVHVIINGYTYSIPPDGKAEIDYEGEKRSDVGKHITGGCINALVLKQVEGITKKINEIALHILAQEDSRLDKNDKKKIRFSLAKLFMTAAYDTGVDEEGMRGTVEFLQSEQGKADAEELH